MVRMVYCLREGALHDRWKLERHGEGRPYSLSEQGAGAKYELLLWIL